MVENVCTEIYGDEYRLCSHPIISRTVQVIIQLAPHYVLAQILHAIADR